MTRGSRRPGRRGRLPTPASTADTIVSGIPRGGSSNTPLASVSRSNRKIWLGHSPTHTGNVASTRLRSIDVNTTIRPSSEIAGSSAPAALGHAVATGDQFDGGEAIGVATVPHVHLRRREAAGHRPRPPAGQRVRCRRVGPERQLAPVRRQRRLGRAAVAVDRVGRLDRHTGDRLAAAGIADRHRQIDDRDRGDAVGCALGRIGERHDGTAA